MSMRPELAATPGQAAYDQLLKLVRARQVILLGGIVISGPESEYKPVGSSDVEIGLHKQSRTRTWTDAVTGEVDHGREVAYITLIGPNTGDKPLRHSLLDDGRVIQHALEYDGLPMRGAITEAAQSNWISTSLNAESIDILRSVLEHR